MNRFFHVLLCTSLLAFVNGLPLISQAAPALNVEVSAERTHKTTLFTQGLVLHQGYFYESSGLYNQSLLVSYPLAEPDSTWAKLSAPFHQKQKIPARYFAEGLALHEGKLYLLTWREQTLLVYDQTSFNYLKSLPYEGEGWGLTSNGEHLIRSDGSDRLYFHSPEDFALVKTLKVTDGNKPVRQINELEFAQGALWANIWHEDRIIKIDPVTGAVVGEMHLAFLKEGLNLSRSEQVLNGIAWDEQRQAFWVTGKLWPRLFLIRVKD